ncbi:ABC transporter ATP-binding protein [Spiroplasma sp. NBRC 100390]|uniref:ABC transporter ATP-binding protein n=1 Tax=unclassified Spiroplasma TaxID=2637901 RepID=UPI0008929B76|nr:MULTISPECIES: ABC transporter ATP-binding protein [unclassified Spiroplasma]AOX44008.1 ABC transporter ATP-binding protein [Spiroplasma sp. TU-14]APE13478.1 ABC transporter ATP-binding protein [Spiroplasma sp. NBRC 100390]
MSKNSDSTNLSNVQGKQELVKGNKKKTNPMGFFKLLSIYYKQFWLRWLCLIIFVIITCGITVALPKLTNIVMTQLTSGMLARSSINDPSMPWGTLLYWAIGFAATFIVSGFFLYLQSLVGGSISRKIEIDIRIKVLNKLVDLDMNYYHDKKMGDILTKLISDTQILGDQAFQVPQNFLNAFFTFIGSIAIMFTLDNRVLQYQDGPNGIVPVVDANGNLVYMDGTATVAELAGIILGVSFGILLLTSFGFTFIRRLMYKQRKVVSDVNGDVNDRINAIRLIKATGTNEYEKDRFNDIHKEYYKVSMRAIKVQSLIIAFVVTTLTSMNTIALIVGIVFVNDNRLDPTVMLSITMSINSLIFPIIQVVRLLANLATASTSATRVAEIFDQVPKININPTTTPLTDINGDIVFDKVWFKYDVEGEDEPYILENFSFHFKQGKSYAFVGETGVGKSTISKLLLRYYDPSKGEIYVNNNQNLKTINLKSYLDHVGYVEQEPQILYGTFYDNIRYGTFAATDAECESAAKKAELYDFITELPEGFATVLGERGFILSGGQKQRLVIARMFLRNPEILILDEATSALDNIVEKEIQGELDKLMAGRTTIIIAHRLSTIKNVDQILVLEKGSGVVQSGTFDELKKVEGRFKRLYEAGLMT